MSQHVCYSLHNIPLSLCSFPRHVCSQRTATGSIACFTIVWLPLQNWLFFQQGLPESLAWLRRPVAAPFHSAGSLHRTMEGVKFIPISSNLVTVTEILLRSTVDLTLPIPPMGWALAGIIFVGCVGSAQGVRGCGPLWLDSPLQPRCPWLLAICSCLAKWLQRICLSNGVSCSQTEVKPIPFWERFYDCWESFCQQLRPRSSSSLLASFVGSYVISMNRGADIWRWSPCDFLQCRGEASSRMWVLSFSFF